MRCAKCWGPMFLYFGWEGAHHALCGDLSSRIHCGRRAVGVRVLHAPDVLYQALDRWCQVDRGLCMVGRAALISPQACANMQAGRPMRGDAMGVLPRTGMQGK